MGVGAGGRWTGAVGARSARWLTALLLFGTVAIARPAGAAPQRSEARITETRRPARLDGRMFERRAQRLGLQVGYSIAMPNAVSDGPITRMQYLTILPEWAMMITRHLAPDAWYGGAFEFLVQGQLIFEMQPENGFVSGGLLTFRYDFLALERVKPFIELGGGIQYMNLDVPGRADGFGFNWQTGLGAHVLLSRRTAIDLSWVYQHLSNAGTRLPNGGVEQSTFRLGVSFSV